MTARVQTLPKRAVGKYLGDFGQYLEMFIGCSFRYQNNQNVRYRSPVGRIVRKRGFEAQIGKLYP